MDKKVLVLCVDRDDDIGRKTNIEGPVVGREENIELAKTLGLADPQESDTNAIFEAIKIYDSRDDAEVATITGDVNVGVNSDEKMAQQLEDVINRTGAEKIILVTDGVEDEHIIPVLQSYGDIVSVRRVIVKQSERLEGMYYQINDFLSEVVNNPKTSRLVLGIPAIFLLLYSLLGAAGWRIMLGTVGIYLLIRGFKMEKYIFNMYEEIKLSFTARRVSFFIYIVAIAITIIGTKSGYDSIQATASDSIIEMSAAFVQGAVYLLFLAALVAIVGKTVTAFPNRSKIFRYTTFTSFFLGLAVVGHESAKIILMPDIGLSRFLVAIIFGFIVVSFTLTLERKFG